MFSKKFLQFVHRIHVSSNSLKQILKKYISKWKKKHTTEKFRKENYSFDLAVDELPLEMVELLDVEFVLVVISVPKLPDIDVVVPVV